MQAGDLLVTSVTARVSSASALSTPAGWTEVRRDFCDGPRGATLAQALAYRVAVGPEPSTYLWGVGESAAATGQVAAFRGVTSSVLSHSGRYARNTRGVKTSSIDVSQNALVVGVFGYAETHAFETPDGYSTHAAATAAASAPAASVLAAAGEQGGTSTGEVVGRLADSSDCNLGQLAAFRLGSASGPPPPPPPPPSPPPPSPPPPSPPPPSPPPPSPPPPSPPPPSPPPPSPPPPSPPPPSPPPPSPPPPSPPPPSPPPPSPPPPSPPPSPGGSVVLTNQSFVCRGPVNLNLVKVTMTTAHSDAIKLDNGCTGRIGRIEVDTWTLDGVKVQNSSSNAAHDVVVESGYVKCHAMAPGAHQDAVQAMGGRNLRFRNITFDCLGNSNFFVTTGGGGATTPTDVVCEGCTLGPRSSTTIRVNNAIRSGARNSFLCPGRNHTMFWGNPTYVNVGNTILSSNDARCR